MHVRRVLVLLLLTCCARVEHQRPSVILISVDTLRSDHLSAYGYRGVATPHLDALRRDAILYERAFSHCPMTLPSHASILTGRLPTENGVRNNLGDRLDASKFPTVARVLRDHGYRTGAAVSSYVLRAETGIADGFDVYDDSVTITPGVAASEHQRSGFDTLHEAETFVKRNAAHPFFLFFHIYEPHAPYVNSYDAEIATSDAIVGRLIATLKRAGVYDSSAVIFLSDHGEALGEHGEDQHGILLYREVLQVPLMIKLPRSERAGSAIAEPFALRQIHDRILELTGIAKPLPGETSIYSETIYPRIHLGWSELRSIIDGRYHYIESSSPELYDLARDPAERTNLFRARRRVSVALRAKLRAIPAPDIRVQPVRTGPLQNPREQIESLAAMREAFQLASEHHNDEAIAAMEALLKKNPRLLEVSTRLGEVLSESGRHDEAIAVYRAALQNADRSSPDTALALARAYLAAGKPVEAAEHAGLAVRTNPSEASMVLARAAIEQQRFREAEEWLRRVRGDPQSLLVLSDLMRAEGNVDGALQTLAMVKGPLFGLEHRRADLLARLDRPAEAIAAYEREIAAYPQHLQSYANLALIHLIEGRKDEAERALERMAAANPHRGAYELAAKTLETAGDAAGAARWREKWSAARPRAAPRRPGSAAAPP